MQNQQGLSAEIVGYITARGQEKLEKLDKEITKLKGSAAPADQAELERVEQKYRDEQTKFIPVNWLDDAARRAGQLQLVTHAPKFIHSDARASGIYAADSASQKADGTVSTASIARPSIDVIGNAAALDVGKLLQLSFAGKALVDHIAADDISPLLPFAKDAAQATQWLADFKKAVQSNAPAAHKLTKQVYWPLTEGEEQYHLLAPLFGSSFQHAVYQTINSCRFSEQAKGAKEARKTQKPSELPVVNFVNIAEQHFGGTKPQNISQLNSQRYGKGLLLNSSGPPQWQTVAKPPLNVDSIFHGIFDRRAGKLANKLKWYLELVYERPSVIEIRDERAERIDRIIDILFAYVGEMHQFPPGWSADGQCHLPIEEQLLLDPKRREFDKAFLQHWDSKEWPQQVAARFSRWLNRYLARAQVQSKKLAPGQVEYVQLKDIVAQKLRILKDDFSDFYDEQANVQKQQLQPPQQHKEHSQ